MMPVLIVGDSHARVWIGNSDIYTEYKTYRKENILVESVGEYTSYNLPQKSDVKEKIKEYCEKNDITKNKTILMLIFGEIDCRCHLAPRILSHQSSQSEEECIINEVSKAQKPLLDLYDEHPQFCRVLWGIHLAYPKSEAFGRFVNGKPELRRKIVEEWNRQLIEYGNKRNTPILNPCDYNGNVDVSNDLMDIFKDPCHLYHDKSILWLHNKLKEISKIYSQ